MHSDDKRILFTCIEIFGQHQPSLHPHRAIVPMHVAHLAPRRFNFGVKVGELLPTPNGSGPGLGGVLADCRTIAVINLSPVNERPGTQASPEGVAVSSPVQSVLGAWS